LKIMRKENKDAKIIMVTGQDDRDSTKAASKLGATDYITKPLELANLYTVVSKYL